MSVKIRMKRMGSKRNPFYRIVVADSRYARNGRIIEQLGTYDPVSEQGDVVLDDEKALEWLKEGAQPSDTVRKLLSNRGIMEKLHDAKYNNK